MKSNQDCVRTKSNSVADDVVSGRDVNDFMFVDCFLNGRRVVGLAVAFCAQ